MSTVLSVIAKQGSRNDSTLVTFEVQLVIKWVQASKSHLCHVSRHGVQEKYRSVVVTGKVGGVYKKPL